MPVEVAAATVAAAAAAAAWPRPRLPPAAAAAAPPHRRPGVGAAVARPPRPPGHRSGSTLTPCRRPNPHPRARTPIGVRPTRCRSSTANARPTSHCVSSRACPGGPRPARRGRRHHCSACDALFIKHTQREELPLDSDPIKSPDSTSIAKPSGTGRSGATSSSSAASKRSRLLSLGKPVEAWALGRGAQLLDRAR